MTEPEQIDEELQRAADRIQNALALIRALRAQLCELKENAAGQETDPPRSLAAVRSQRLTGRL